MKPPEKFGTCFELHRFEHKVQLGLFGATALLAAALTLHGADSDGAHNTPPDTYVSHSTTGSDDDTH